MNSIEFATEQKVRTALLQGAPLLDVRAPVEFAEGSLPGAVNYPILDDEERHQIGIIYKQSGPAAAVARGESLVTGETKARRVALWAEFLKNNSSALLYCFRGGQRSAYAQRWIREMGIEVLRIEGGYKKWRTFLMEDLKQSAHLNLIVLGGRTGSAKTRLLRDLQTSIRMVDLEDLANHRGSAFGGQLTPQPTQIDFENRASIAFSRLGLQTPSPIVVEDESRLIGRLRIPETLYAHMKTRPMVVLEETIESRVQHIFEEYVLEPLTMGLHPHELLARLELNLDRIIKKLGGQRHQEIQESMRLAFSKSDFSTTDSPHLIPLHWNWIERLLLEYYDPMYEFGFQKKGRPILFKGTRREVYEFLEQEAHL